MGHFQVTMPGHDRDRSLGHLAAAWIEYFYRHGDGDIRGDAYTLDDDFYDFTVDAYALAEDGRRLYKLAVMSRPKGTAKSEYAAAVALFEGLGPCRFDGWAKGGETYDFLGFSYTYLPGEPMGRPITDPVVRIMATEETQTGNTYGNVLATLNEKGNDDRSELAGWIEERGDVHAGFTGMRLPGGGKILLSTGGSKSKDGGKESFGIGDETHLYTGGLINMYNTVKRNLSKRRAADPWLLTTTTMYQDGEGSVGEMQHKQALAIAAGKKKNPQMLFDHREGSPITDLSDEKELRASLREAYAERGWVDYDAMVNDVNDGTTDPAEFRRYFLNQVASSDSAYVNGTELDAIMDSEHSPVKPLTKGDVVTLGFDYAPGNRGAGRAQEKEVMRKGVKVTVAVNARRRFRVPDATALVACRLEDMSLHPIGIWEADEKQALTEGWNPPLVDIEARVHETFAKYKVVGMYADPSGIESYLDKWTAKYLSRLKVRAMGDRPMYRYMSGKSATRSGKDVDAMYEAIASQQIRIGPSDTLTAILIRHFLNARRSVTQYGTALYKVNPESPNKIDGAVASVLAFAAAKDATNKGVAATGKKPGRARRLY